MSQRLRFASNEAGAAQIAAHFRECDTVFVPPLSGRVDIDDYAHKIVTHGQRFEAWSGEVLVGLVAVYCNASDKRTAFITSVSTLPSWQGQGVAAHVLRDCIAHVRTQDFARIELEVDGDNLAALSLYEKSGFMRSHVSHHPTTMTLDLRKDG